jgi:hypothetical protein
MLWPLSSFVSYITTGSNIGRRLIETPNVLLISSRFENAWRPWTFFFDPRRSNVDLKKRTGLL